MTDAIDKWSVTQVGKWLQEVELADMVDVFKDNDVDGEVLLDLNDQYLKELGVTSVGKRVKILKRIALLKTETSIGEGSIATSISADAIPSSSLPSSLSPLASPTLHRPPISIPSQQQQASVETTGETLVSASAFNFGSNNSSSKQVQQSTLSAHDRLRLSALPPPPPANARKGQQPATPLVAGEGTGSESKDTGEPAHQYLILDHSNDGESSAQPPMMKFAAGSGESVPPKPPRKYGASIGVGEHAKSESETVSKVSDAHSSSIDGQNEAVQGDYLTFSEVNKRTQPAVQRMSKDPASLSPSSPPLNLPLEQQQHLSASNSPSSSLSSPASDEKGSGTSIEQRTNNSNDAHATVVRKPSKPGLLKRQLINVAAKNLSNPEFCGFLTKRGDKVKNWKRRWCVIKDFCLYYYKSQSDDQALGKIVLPSYQVSAAPEITGKKHAFKVYHSNMRVYYFYADDAENMQHWTNALSMATQANFGSGAQSPSASSSSSAYTSKPAAPLPKMAQQTQSSSDSSYSSSDGSPAYEAIIKKKATPPKVTPYQDNSIQTHHGNAEPGKTSITSEDIFNANETKNKNVYGDKDGDMESSHCEYANFSQLSSTQFQNDSKHSSTSGSGGSLNYSSNRDGLVQGLSSIENEYQNVEVLRKLSVNSNTDSLSALSAGAASVPCEQDSSYDILPARSFQTQAQRNEQFLGNKPNNTSRDEGVGSEYNPPMPPLPMESSGPAAVPQERLSLPPAPTRDPNATFIDLIVEDDDGDEEADDDGGKAYLAITEASVTTEANFVKAIAVYDNEADDEGELSYAVGDIILIKNRDRSDWWFGELNGQSGLVVAAYVEVIED